MNPFVDVCQDKIWICVYFDWLVNMLVVKLSTESGRTGSKKALGTHFKMLIIKNQYIFLLLSTFNSLPFLRTILFLIDSLLPSVLSFSPSSPPFYSVPFFHTHLFLLPFFHPHLPLLWLPSLFHLRLFLRSWEQRVRMYPSLPTTKQVFSGCRFQPESRNITFLMWSNVKHWPNCDPRCLYWSAPYEKVMLWGSLYLQESGNYTEWVRGLKNEFYKETSVERFEVTGTIV